MNSCHACGQLVESRWQVCPYCTSPLGQHTQQYAQPAYSQPQYHTEHVEQNSVVQEYQVYPQQMIITQNQKSGKSVGLILLILIFAIAFIVVISGVLYVWASSLADDSRFTWSGDLNSEYQDVRWYDSAGDWETYSSSNTVDGSNFDELTQNFTKIEAQFQYGEFRITYDAESSSEYEDFIVDGKHQVIGDVWFLLMTELTSDGQVTDVDNGECIAQIHEDAYNGPNSWRNEVESTNWPSWCDTVADL